MEWQSMPYVLALLITAAMAILLALYAWRRRGAVGVVAFLWLMLAAAEWSLTYALEIGSTRLVTKLFWAKVQYFGIVIIPVAWLVLALEYAGRGRWVTRRNIILLSAVPAVTLLGVWSYGMHDLLWSQATLDTHGPFTAADLTHGAWFWVHVAYSYLLLLTGTILLIQCLQHYANLYRRQATVIVLGALMPWIGNIVYLSGMSPFYSLDLTPFAFTLTGVGVSWGLYRYHLLDIVPVARDALIDGMIDGTVVLDNQNRIVDLNAAAQRIIGPGSSELIGQPAGQVLTDVFDLSEHIPHTRDHGAEVILPWQAEGAAGSHYELRISALCNGRGRSIGRLVLVRDISERKRAEAEREAMLQSLRRRNRELALLSRVSKELTATLEVDQVIGRLLQEVTRAIDAEAASVWLREEERTDWLRCHAAYQHNGGGSPVDIRLRPGQGIAGWVAQTGDGALVPGVSEDMRFFSGVDEHTGLRTHSLLAVPLMVRSMTIGVLEVINKKHGDFDEADLTLVKTLSASAAIAIENARLVQKLRTYALELEARNEDLDAFARSAAHDLKGPLAKLVGYCEVLADLRTALPENEVDQHLQKVAQQGRKMSNIVDEMLLLASVRRQGDVPLQSLTMAPIVAEACERLSDLIIEHRAEIILPEIWPVALGYGPWIEEVWVNYISNAIKYGGQPPRIELGADFEADDLIRFWVRDNGRGLMQIEKEHLFKPFTRLDETQVNGHGLGLSIVRRILEKLGGEVGVESHVGQGSVFSFALPRK